MWHRVLSASMSCILWQCLCGHNSRRIQPRLPRVRKRGDCRKMMSTGMILCCGRGGFTGPYILGLLSSHGFALPMYVLGGCNLVAACILLAFRIPPMERLHVAGKAAASAPRVPETQGMQDARGRPACIPLVT